MDKSAKRNWFGCLVCFVLCALFGGLGLAFMMCREVQQSDDAGVPVEKDDITRYSLVGCLGYIVNVILLVTLF